MTLRIMGNKNIILTQAIYGSPLGKPTPSYSMLAIDRSDGSLWGWGRNITGVNGDGGNTPTSSPVSVLKRF